MRRGLTHGFPHLHDCSAPESSSPLTERKAPALENSPLASASAAFFIPANTPYPKAFPREWLMLAYSESRYTCSERRKAWRVTSLYSRSWQPYTVGT
ncbi:hypothetical protein [Bacteroides pyogenes]|uniref:hypothetical protein n=1 Tax=Bacteroides pyogenes TaxID=310300 RepID=UPI0020136456|nr:hypothetical protein [Bacteroides pyogenes]